MGSTHDTTQRIEAGHQLAFVGVRGNVDAWRWRWSWMTAGASTSS